METPRKQTIEERLASAEQKLFDANKQFNSCRQEYQSALDLYRKYNSLRVSFGSIIADSSSSISEFRSQSQCEEDSIFKRLCTFDFFSKTWETDKVIRELKDKMLNRTMNEEEYRSIENGSHIDLKKLVSIVTLDSYLPNILKPLYRSLFT